MVIPAIVALPAPRAGLPASSAMVWVGPPLLGQPGGETWLRDADQVIIDAVDQAADADHVVRTGRGGRAVDVVGDRIRASADGIEHDDGVVQGGRAIIDVDTRTAGPGRTVL